MIVSINFKYFISIFYSDKIINIILILYGWKYCPSVFPSPASDLMPLYM